MYTYTVVSISTLWCKVKNLTDASLPMRYILFSYIVLGVIVFALYPKY